MAHTHGLLVFYSDSILVLDLAPSNTLATLYGAFVMAPHMERQHDHITLVHPNRHHSGPDRTLIFNDENPCCASL
jgi:hypothetical protein